MIDQQYADDKSWASNNETRIRKLRRKIPPLLQDKNLQTNDTKQKSIKREEEELIARRNVNIWEAYLIPRKV